MMDALFANIFSFRQKVWKMLYFKQAIIIAAKFYAWRLLAPAHSSNVIASIPLIRIKFQLNTDITILMTHSDVHSAHTCSLISRNQWSNQANSQIAGTNRGNAHLVINTYVIASYEINYLHVMDNLLIN